MSDDDIAEFFAALGSVSVRRMFGGKGIYHEGVIIALVLRDELMLKADEETAPAFAAAGAARWTYQRPGRNPVEMPYWTVPDEALDDPDATAAWVRRAAEAGRRAASRVVRTPRRVFAASRATKRTRL
jgi:DNA transformation protein and related proteins